MRITQILLCVGAVLVMAAISYDGYSQAVCRVGTLKKAAEKARAKAEAEKYDVFLLIGQSNMAGRAAMENADTTLLIPSVWLLNGDDLPEPARNPLNRYSTVRKDRNSRVYSNQKIGLGTDFSRVIAEKTGRKVLLIVNAMGETTIEEWAKEAPVIGLSSSIGNSKYQLYSEAVRRCKQAMKYGNLKAILWHQGEGNSGADRVPKYPEQIAKLVADLRKDLNAPNVPFIVGELSHLRGNGSGSDNFNAMIRGISTFVDNSNWVSAEGLSTNDPVTSSKSNPDLTHFNREGQLELGRRYAEKVLQMCYPVVK